MEEDESFDEFYAMLKDIVNSAFNLGEIIPEPKIVRKVLRSLPERFHAKITAIEESKDIDQIPLTKLVGNLQTYDIGLTKIGKMGKGKSMALKAIRTQITVLFNFRYIFSCLVICLYYHVLCMLIWLINKLG